MTTELKKVHLLFPDSRFSDSQGNSNLSHFATPLEEIPKGHKGLHVTQCTLQYQDGTPCYVNTPVLATIPAPLPNGNFTAIVEDSEFSELHFDDHWDCKDNQIMFYAGIPFRIRMTKRVWYFEYQQTDQWVNVVKDSAGRWEKVRSSLQWYMFTGKNPIGKRLHWTDKFKKDLLFLLRDVYRPTIYVPKPPKQEIKMRMDAFTPLNDLNLK